MQSKKRAFSAVEKRAISFLTWLLKKFPSVASVDVLLFEDIERFEVELASRIYQSRYGQNEVH